jgi:transposase
LAKVAGEQLSPAVLLLEATEAQLGVLHRQLLRIARHLRGARELEQRLYGVGPITALALVCWLGGAGRFSSARKAVRFAGLDITVYSSAGKRSPGRLSRQGPPVLRWCLYEAGKAHARASAPGYAYYAAVKKKIDGKRAALSQARRIVREATHILTELGDDAFAYV